MPISAIIPAYNEEKTIYSLIKLLKSSELFSEIIVVNDGSVDRTAALAQKAGATVISLPKNLGKGEALTIGVRASCSPIVFFWDADLSGVSKKHFQDLLNPILENRADMVVGLTPEWQGLYEFSGALPILSGQRAMRREIFEQVPELLRKGYQIEEALNYYCKARGQRAQIVKLDGITHLRKISKRGLLVGLREYWKMSWQVVKIFVVVRLIGIFFTTLRGGRRPTKQSR